MQAEEGLDASLIGRPGITSIEQLRGQHLAGDPGDSNLDLIRRKILRTHSINEDQYDVEIIGSSPVRLEVFLEGRVAAAMLTPPSSEKALSAGGVLLARAEDYVPEFFSKRRLEATSGKGWEATSIPKPFPQPIATLFISWVSDCGTWIRKP